MKKTSSYVAALAAVVVIILGIWQGSIYLEGKKPDITVPDDLSHVGLKTTFSVTFSDEGRGLRQVLAFIDQGGKRLPLGGMDFSVPGEMKKTMRLTLDQVGLDLSEGPATLVFTAVDHSLRKNSSTVTIPVTVDRTPPRISTMTSNHYINPGGSCLVVYRLSEPAEKTGVLVNTTFFPGYPFDSEESRPRFAVLFAIPVDARNDNMKIGITACDRAGNESFATFSHHIRKATFRDRTLPLSDRFLEATMPEFQTVIPALRDVSPLEAFIYVNEELRRENTRQIEAICSRSEPRKLWDGHFLRMSNAATMAGFGDRRTYTYKGSQVTESLHDGVDLASTVNAVIEASNRGIVTYTGYLGIYGNTVIIDHGLGLFSFYAHLSSIDTEKGALVEKGEPLGRSGMTGLAGGDHLHFGIFLGKQFVNPVEWWDPGWIRDNILGKADLP